MHVDISFPICDYICINKCVLYITTLRPLRYVIYTVDDIISVCVCVLYTSHQRNDAARTHAILSKYTYMNEHSLRFWIASRLVQCSAKNLHTKYISHPYTLYTTYRKIIGKAYICAALRLNFLAAAAKLYIKLYI